MNKSRLKYYVVCDFEMNPVAKTDKIAKEKMKNEIIEMAAYKLDKSLRVIDSFKTYVKPERNYKIESNIFHLTGICSGTVHKSTTFAEALKQFEEWVGSTEEICMYCWSDSDFTQLSRECAFKGLDMPNWKWFDLQRVFSRIMHISHDRRKISLRDAAHYLALDFDATKAHDALYDSEMTAKILVRLLDGSYKEQIACMNSLTRPEKSVSTIGDLYGEILRNLLQELQTA